MPGLDDVHKAIEEGNSAPGTAPETTSNEIQQEPAAQAGPGDSQLTQQQAQDIVDLEKLSKFKWEGKEWSLDDLKKSVMRHADYSKKTQAFREREKSYEEKLKTYEEQRKFDDNLDADLENVRQNPSLAARFREVYPERYHRFLDHSVSTPAQGQTTQSVDPGIMREIQAMKQRLEQTSSELESWKGERFESEVKANEALLDSACEKYKSKFDLADEETVLSKAQFLINKGHFGDPKDPEYTEKFMKGLEGIYKQSHDANVARYEARYKQQVEKQKQANGRAKDVAAGGGIPGKAPVKRSLKQVAEEFEAHITSQA